MQIIRNAYDFYKPIACLIRQDIYDLENTEI